MRSALTCPLKHLPPPSGGGQNRHAHPACFPTCEQLLSQALLFVLYQQTSRHTYDWAVWIRYPKDTLLDGVSLGQGTMAAAGQAVARDVLREARLLQAASKVNGTVTCTSFYKLGSCILSYDMQYGMCWLANSVMLGNAASNGLFTARATSSLSNSQLHKRGSTCKLSRDCFVTCTGCTCLQNLCRHAPQGAFYNLLYNMFVACAGCLCG